ncbi:beta-ketoacyl synthase N-terminal-like domain-containing protein [Catellatospora sp. NPDC049609]|uniref:type I polyketide synthase n=1 Tax=Catellatospora sp. NPDC049609 TaxID=3155505 RepID=UPI00341746E3
MADEPIDGPEPIAVIGMACRVPGAADLDRFWQNLVGGHSARTELSREHLLRAGVPAAEVDDPDYVPVAYLLDDVADFDAGLFGLTPREAALADPQHRLFLELCHAALEHAGWDPARHPGDIGVYGGRGMETYRWRHLHANRAVMASTDHTTIGNGNHADTFTTLASYHLNLRGPSVGIYTACSTSLVAVHTAAEALRAGECDMALAGGVSIELPGDRGYLHREGSAASADGHVRPFDAAATGTVAGSGGGVVLLKRLADALADGDHVHAVVLGNAVNNDGAAKIGFTASGVAGQAAVVANALATAGVDPRTVGYVEASATGSPLGDAIEVEALTSVYGRGSGERQWCALGSVKSNIGHLSQGAGVVGLIKTALALEHGLIPASLGYTAPHPALDLAASPFYVNATLATWTPDSGPRRAAVSSFGIGGTNAHVVLEAPPAARPTRADRPVHLLRISARSAAARDAAAARLADHLATAAGLDLADVAHTLRVGRVEHPHRCAVVAADPADAAAALRTPDRRLQAVAEVVPGVVFLFGGPAAASSVSGIGAAEPVFAAEVDRCAALLGLPVDELLSEPFLASFSTGYATARLWRSWGVRPATMIGHGTGEYVAAVLAGVFDLPAALRLVALHARLVRELPAEATFTVSATPETLARLLPAEAAVVAVNGPATCVVTSPPELLERLTEPSGRKIAVRRLRTTHPPRPAVTDEILARYAEAVAAEGPSAPATSYLSGRTGAPITAREARDPAYWAGLLREPVRFGPAVAAALAAGPVQFVECGPGRQLAGLARMQTPRGGPQPLHSLPAADEPGDALATCYAAAGRLWAQGVPVDLGSAGRRVPLPGYPYERTRHWIDPDPPTVAAAADAQPTRLAEADARPTSLAAPDGPRAALGEPAAAQAPTALDHRADTDTAHGLAGIWSTLLGADEIKPDDDYFALGGSSLTAVQLIAQVRAAFGVRLTMRVIFDAPTLRAMADAIDERRAAARR